MARTSEFVETGQPGSDLAFLRSALKPYDPADRPLPLRSSEPVQPQDRRGGRPRWSILAVAGTVVAAGLAPVMLVDTATSSDDHRRAAEGALMSCREREVAGVPDFVASTEGAVSAAERATVTWYSPAKADRLTSALRAALPAGTCIWPGSESGNLRFEVGASGVFSILGGNQVLGPSTDGRLVTATGDGTLMASVYAATTGPQDCFVGEEDTRFTTPDGIIVSQQVASAGDARVLLVQAARPDGSCIWLRASDEVLRQDTAEDQQGMTATGSVPLTMNDLTALATAPGVDITS